MAKMEAGPRGEQALTERAVSDNNPAGDWVADEGSDWRKDAGDDGGAIKGMTMPVGLLKFPAVETAASGTTGSGTRTAWPIRLLFL